MKNSFASIAACILLSSGLALTGCSNSGQWEKEDANLLSQAVTLEQRHCQLKASIDSLWDVTTTRLEPFLPADFPTVDRDIFLKARNADHIRMFMSFKKLDAKAQSLVNEAGEQDEILAKQVQALIDQKEAFEHQKNQFLQKVEKQDRSASRSYAEKLRTATAGLCSEHLNR